MDNQQKMIDLLLEFKTCLNAMTRTNESDQALKATNDFLGILQKKKSLNDFLLSSQGGAFTKEITLLRGGFGSNKLKLDAKAIELFNSIESLIPTAGNKYNTFYVPWGS